MGCCQSIARTASPSPSAIHHSPSVATAGPTPSATSPASPNSPSRSRAHRPLHNHSLSAPPNAPLRPHRRFVSPSTQQWTLSRLTRERAAFFETRVTGRPEVWSVLRSATELLRDGDVVTAQSLLDAAGVTVPTGDLVQGAYDEGGAMYPMLEWVVADPEIVEADEEDPQTRAGNNDRNENGLGSVLGGKGLGFRRVGVTEEHVEEEVKGDAEGKSIDSQADERIRVRARLSDRAKDVVVWTAKDESVRSFVNRVREEARLDAHVRIAYMGHVLHESDSLTAQGWKEGHVVNALVFQ